MAKIKENPLKTWMKLMFAHAATELVHDQNSEARRHSYTRKRVEDIKATLKNKKQQ